MDECSEHFFNGLATIAAVNNAQLLLQSNLVIMRHNFLPPRGRSKNSRSESLRVLSVSFVVCTQNNTNTISVLTASIDANSLPFATDADKRYTGHRLPVSTRINEQEVDQAGCCLKITPGPYATKLFILILSTDRPVLSCLCQSYSTHCVCEQQGSRSLFKLLAVRWVNSLLTAYQHSAEHRLLCAMHY